MDSANKPTYILEQDSYLLNLVHNVTKAVAPFVRWDKNKIKTGGYSVK